MGLGTGALVAGLFGMNVSYSFAFFATTAQFMGSS